MLPPQTAEIAEEAPGARAMQDILDEYERATKLWGPFASPEQGICIIAEELGELAQAVLQNQTTARVRAEAVQVAAMGLRFIGDCCGHHGATEM